MQRRGNGEGTIYKNEKLNMWTGQYTKPNGKRGFVYKEITTNGKH